VTVPPERYDAPEEALYALDAAGRVSFVNRAAEALLGWREHELLGRDMHTVIHYERPDGSPFPAEECPLLAVLTSGRVVRSDDDVFIRRDGTHIRVAYTSSPLMEGGAVLGTVLTFSPLAP
jgi:PAS domain S-box-containing protein